MKIKTSTRISIIFSIFTFLVILIVLILLNIFSFYGWYEEEKVRVEGKIDKEYEEIISEYYGFEKQKSEFLEEIIEYGGFIGENYSLLGYHNFFLNLYYKDSEYYFVDIKSTIFGNVFLPYNVTGHIHSQIRLIKLGLIFLIIFTVLGFFISNKIFIKLALKDIFYISNKLKNIDLNNIKKIKINLNKNDEVNIIVDSINSFLGLIKQNTESLKKFNAQVSHEFKTPLMAISTELEYLSLSGKNNESYKKIGKQINILNELLETFLFISKIENFKGDIKKNTINISEILDNKIKDLELIYKDLNIEISKNIKKVNINTNKKLFDILVKNILDNAFKYNKKGGKIDIVLTKKYLVIKDTGIGVEKDKLSKIFDSFYRLDEKKKGYGVGLNIVKKIADILGYKIDVKSNYLEGTEFKIIF